ncbi:uncharacterized protein LOC116166341 [Photinus pyralis]|uniref:uncharacterized protein LOC116166341 n=1 Tax=Photinus pyralis TaxID=7054 RepID=UPI0012673265|nr:uncharacterized protein LOC116166341 [Photinus pyralis]
MYRSGFILSASRPVRSRQDLSRLIATQPVEFLMPVLTVVHFRMDVETLISLVQAKEAIYDPKHPKHRDRDFIAAVWRGIARELNTTDAEVKAKWQNLRSNYMREKRKLKSVPSGAATNSVPKITWPYFKFLWFLDPTLKHKATSGNVPESVTANTDDTSEGHIESQDELQEESQQSPPDSPRALEEDFHQQAYDVIRTSSCATPAFGSLTRRKRQIQTNETENAMQDVQRETQGDRQETYPDIRSPSGSTRSDDLLLRGKRQKKKIDTENEIDRQYLKHLQAISDNAKDDQDPDLLFLRSLLPSMKQLGPLENLEFKGEVINLLQTKIRSQSNPPSVAASTFSHYSASSAHSLEELADDITPTNTLESYVLHTFK